MSKVGGSDPKNTLFCSFCGKSQHEVRKLIAGPTVFICDECIALCMAKRRSWLVALVAEKQQFGRYWWNSGLVLDLMNLSKMTDPDMARAVRRRSAHLL